MSHKCKQVSVFVIEGRFLGYVLEDGYKIKRIRLATIEGEQCIKLSKEARVSLGRVLSPGEWVQVWGEKTVKPESGEVKLKAYRMTLAPPGQIPAMGDTQSVLPAAMPAPAKPKSASVLVCQKSDCLKQGGRAVCTALEQALAERGLQDQVTVRGTGCMKHCKAGPNIVFMPTKTRYSRVSAAEIPALIDQHFPQAQPDQSIDQPNALSTTGR
jgi:(2Fe-2S) ferredoxin